MRPDYIHNHVSAPTAIPYRPDIDGLRAIAVLSVIFFHAGFRWAPGGYTGVDVFFVISGYLITGIMRRQFHDGTFSLGRFYERRARRILPALLVVVASTLAACVAIMFTDDARVAARSAVSVLAFAANIVFWRGVDFGDVTTVNYFGRRLDEQPFLHTWSLGVEEQYYLLFPLTLLLIWRLRPALVMPALIAGGLASFALCVLLTPRSPGLAFYLLPTRIWELLAGGVLAWYRGPTGAPRWLQHLTPMAGLTAILLPVWIYDSDTAFPGAAAALPVLGTAALLWSAPGTAAGRVLSWPPLVFVGLISYSAYLWHQPLFALARYVRLTNELETTLTVGLCALTLLLAAASWRWVETPFRDRRRVSSSRLAWSAVLGTLLVAAPAAFLAFGADASRRSPAATNIVAQSVLSLFTDCNASRQVTRALGPGCLLDPSSAAAPSFLVVGDSHADALFPAFARMSRKTGQQGRLLQQLRCLPLLDVEAVPTGVPDCNRMQELALELVTSERLTSVFLVSRFSYFAGAPRIAERLERTIAAYADRGAIVYLLAQAPEQPAFNRGRYIRAVLAHRFRGRDASALVREQSVSRADHDRRQSAANALFAAHRHDPRVRLLDFTDVWCDETTCPVGTPEGPYYSDDHHPNSAGARMVGDALSQLRLSE